MNKKSQCFHQPRLLAIAAATILTAGFVSAAELKELDIPAGDLSTALKSLAKQTGLELIFKPENLRGVKTQGVKGSISPQDAIEKLIIGTELTIKSDPAGAILIAPLSSSAGSSGDANNLRFSELSRLAQSNEQGNEGLVKTSDAESSANAPAGSNGTESLRLEEIVVTARKVSERLKDVPITIDVITRDDLRNAGAADIKDLFGSIPGLSASNADRNLARYSIRGVSSNAGAPTVGIYLDDIALAATGEGGSVGALDPGMFDLERVEVLKGPQGTLYGGSAMGGAIKYVSATPDLSAFSLNMAAGGGYTEHGAPNYSAEAIANIPLISDSLALRFGASFRHEGGYIDSIAGGEIENPSRSSTPSPVYTPLVQSSLSTFNENDYNSTDTWIARASLLWQPDESWSIRPSILLQDYKIDGTNQYFPNQGGLSASYRIPQATKDRATIYGLNIEKTLTRTQLTSLTALVDREQFWNRDYSYLVGNIVPSLFPYTSEARYPTEFKTFSQELRLASVNDPSSRVRWLTGLYYSSQEMRFTPIAYVYAPNSLLAQIFPAFLFPGGVVDENVASTDYRSTLEQSAAFGELTYGLTSALDLTAGVRVFQVRTKVDNVVEGPFNGGHGEAHSTVREDGVNPKFGLSYKVNEDQLIYASASKGFRPGGSSGAQRGALNALCAADLARLGITELPLSYESDDLWTYELGSKNEFSGGRVKVNGAIFHSDWRKIQQFISFPDCGQGFVTNAGEARVDGMEISTEFTLTPELRVGLNGIYTHAKIVDAAPGTVVQDGDQIQDTPKWMGGGFVSYARPLSEVWDLELRADYSYRSEQRRDYVRTQGVTFSDGVNGAVPNSAEFREAYDWANAYVSFRNDSLDVRVFANNLFDSRPVLDQGSSGSTNFTTLRPRTIGIELRRSF